MNRYNLIKTLVDKKYYTTIEEIIEVIDYMVIMQKIDFEQGQELNLLANNLYTVVEDSIVTEEVIESVTE